MTEQPELFNETLGRAGRTFEPHAYLTHQPTDTSEQAAERVLPKSGSQREKVYRFIIQQGERGATDEELNNELRFGENSTRPRRKELQDAGLIMDSGKRRETQSGSKAICWIAT